MQFGNIFAHVSVNTRLAFLTRDSIERFYAPGYYSLESRKEFWRVKMPQICELGDAGDYLHDLHRYLIRRFLFHLRLLARFHGLHLHRR